MYLIESQKVAPFYSNIKKEMKKSIMSCFHVKIIIQFLLVYILDCKFTEIGEPYQDLTFTRNNWSLFDYQNLLQHVFNYKATKV